MYLLIPKTGGWIDYLPLAFKFHYVSINSADPSRVPNDIGKL